MRRRIVIKHQTSIKAAFLMKGGTLGAFFELFNAKAPIKIAKFYQTLRLTNQWAFENTKKMCSLEIVKNSDCFNTLSFLSIIELFANVLVRFWNEKTIFLLINEHDHNSFWLINNNFCELLKAFRSFSTIFGSRMSFEVFCNRAFDFDESLELVRAFKIR